jgi:arsenate reductase (thioredoxin)
MNDTHEAQRRVLFLCTRNSARSQMAEGLLRALGDPTIAAASAGTVATQVHPDAITVMAELGIDISVQTSKTLERYLQEPWDEVITVCDDANDACPLFPGGRNRRHWSTPDPARVQGDETIRLAAFRSACGSLKARIEHELLVK